MTVSELQTKQAIDQALRSFNTGHLAANALALFQTLGYQSDKKFNLYLNTSTNFITTFDQDRKLNPQNALLNEWQSVDFLFQLTWDEITGNSQLQLAFDTSAKVDTTFFTSYLFFAIGLRGSAYTYKQLDAIAREINKLFFIPVMILFRHGSTLTLSIINRRRDKRNDFKDVLEKVKHIKDIPFASPTLAHIKIFFALSLAQLHKKHGFSNFDQFHEAWQKTLDGNDKFPKEADPKDSIRIYLQEIGRIRLLMPDEEIELARKIADLLELERVREQLSRQLKQTPHDTEWANAVKMPLSEFRHRLQIGRKAKNKMVESNLRLVVSIAKKYQNRGVEFQDLIQEGNLGLIRASEKFDYNKGNRFSTYATWWIRQAITRAIANQSCSIRLPVHLWEKLSLVKKTTKLLSQEMGRSPKKEEIATRLEMTTEKLTFIVKSALPIISLDTRIGKEEDSTLGDVIEFDGETPEDYISKIHLREDLESVLDTLRPRERNVLRMRHGLDDGIEKTLQQIGDRFHVTRERIRQIEAEAMTKLRHPSRNSILEGYICTAGVDRTQTKHPTCEQIQPIQLTTSNSSPHHHCDKVEEEQVCSKTVAPSQTTDLITPNASLQRANLEEKNQSQAHLSSADLSETNLNPLNRWDDNLSLTELRKTDFNEIIKPMEQNSADLLQWLAALEEVFSQQGAQLTEALRELQDPGKPLSENLLLELEDSRKNFIELSGKVLELAESLAVSPMLKSDEIVSLKDIKSLLQAVALAEEQSHANEQIRSRALTVLERVLAIAHRVESNFQPLLECQEKARELQSAVCESQGSDLHPDAEALALGNHPFSKLLTLISEREEADDERLVDLHDAVAQSFGRTLAMAAVRGKLIVRAESVPDLPAPSTNKGLEATSLLEPSEPKTLPIVEPPPAEESNVAPAEPAIAPLTTEVIPDSQPVETPTLSLQTEALQKPLTQTHLPNVETRQGADVGSAHPSYARICSVLDKDDALTANKYIDIVYKGQPISEPEKRRDAFINFFKNKYAAIEDVLEPADQNRIKRRELINDISKGRNIGPLQMQQVQGAQAKQASEILGAWFTAKGKKEAISEEDARQILSYLGFNTARLTVNKFERYTWIDVTTEPIQDRNRCPLPAYGSEAKGSYRILCVWDRTTEEDLRNALRETSQASAVIVFHFGRMTEKRHRDLTHSCWKPEPIQDTRRFFIVIDDALMFYLYRH